MDRLNENQKTVHADYEVLNANVNPSHLDAVMNKAISVTKHTDPSRTKELLAMFIRESKKGTLTWNKNLTNSINMAIQKIDEALSQQLQQIMHHPTFQNLEGSWRGLKYLVNNTNTSTNLKLRVLNVSKKELEKDLSRASEFDQSQMFKKIYEDEFGSPGGEPYAFMIGDYQFSNHPMDIDLLSNISQVAAASFCPFISAASPELFGFESFSELSRPIDLAKTFDSIEYIKWRSFRSRQDSRFVTLTMPRVLARLPYGAKTNPVEAFNYEETEIDAKTKMPKTLPHDHFTWMNAAYVMGSKVTHAFDQSGWCTAIRGAEGGGKVTNLPTFISKSDDGDTDMQCPTEIGITDRREAELSKLGLLPLSHYKNTDYAVFFGGQSTQKPEEFISPDATANAAISARLPFVMATSRVAHYLKVMGRDKIGSFKTAGELSDWLQNWINQYLDINPNSSQATRALRPLAEAKIEVKEIAGKPGAYNIVAHLRPWLQLEELTTSLRMVARIPQKTK
ncbi:MAG: type VI secretion system contractile sheath large subunit [Bdellovibrionota bacterium]